VKRRLFGTLVVLALAGAACGGGDDEGDTASNGATASEGSDTASGDTGSAAEPSGDGITIALGSEPTSLDPHTVDDGGERAVNDNVYETLLARDAAGALIPGLATALPTQVDETTWEFTLREGVTFHDGTAFNADAVVASVDRIVRLVEEAKTQNDGFFGSLTGATKVDDFTVQITTAEQDGVLPARMYWLKIVAPGTEASDDLSEAPNGTGPYTFVERVAGDHVSLAANADYWDGAPSIPTVRYEFAEESATRLAGLSSGKYDLITNLAPQDRSTRTSSSTPTRASPPTRTSARRSTSPSTRTRSSRPCSAATPCPTPASTSARRSSATTPTSLRTRTTPSRPRPSSRKPASPASRSSSSVRPAAG
jgi:ABC-type transport system substrate-binding protein